MGKKQVNLNKLIDDTTRARQSVFENTKIKIHFNGQSIVNALVRQIKKRDTRFIVGCCAWLTNKRILEAMSANLDGVAIICTKDKITRSKNNQRHYKMLPRLPSATSAINTLGCGSGYNKSLMHHKFLVGLDAQQQPLWVTNGSFNLTKSAVRHLENCMVIDDKEVAALFKKEFIRLFPLSRPLKLR